MLAQNNAVGVSTFTCPFSEACLSTVATSAAAAHTSTRRSSGHHHRSAFRQASNGHHPCHSACICRSHISFWHLCFLFDKSPKVFFANGQRTTTVLYEPHLAKSHIGALRHDTMNPTLESPRTNCRTTVNRLHASREEVNLISWLDVVEVSFHFATPKIESWLVTVTCTIRSPSLMSS